MVGRCVNCAVTIAVTTGTIVVVNAGYMVDARPVCSEACRDAQEALLALNGWVSLVGWRPSRGDRHTLVYVIARDHVVKALSWRPEKCS